MKIHKLVPKGNRETYINNTYKTSEKENLSCGQTRVSVIDNGLRGIGDWDHISSIERQKTV